VQLALVKHAFLKPLDENRGTGLKLVGPPEGAASPAWSRRLTLASPGPAAVYSGGGYQLLGGRLYRKCPSRIFLICWRQSYSNALIKVKRRRAQRVCSAVRPDP